jgi:hypothetical protein
MFGSRPRRSSISAAFGASPLSNTVVGRAKEQAAGELAVLPRGTAADIGGTGTGHRQGQGS